MAHRARCAAEGAGAADTKQVRLDLPVVRWLKSWWFMNLQAGRKKTDEWWLDG